jgi:hypothetical protein
MTMNKFLIRPGQGVCAHYAITLKPTRDGVDPEETARVDDCGVACVLLATNHHRTTGQDQPKVIHTIIKMQSHVI